MTLYSSGKRFSNDESEFMPVTKKLNLLSIDNCESTDNSSIDGDDSSEHSTQTNYAYANTYSPSLSYNQNPIYYETNRILFEAHQLRLMRSASAHLNR